MNIILDIILIVIFLLIVIIATARGFVKSIWSTVTVLGAFFIAYMFGPTIGDWLCDNWVLDHVTSYAFEIVDDLVAESADNDNYDISALFDTLPDEFTNLITNCGADLDEIKNQFSQSVSVSEDELYSMARSIAIPVSTTVSRVGGILSVFLVSVICFSIIGLLLKLVIKIPILHSLDSVLGFVFGLVKGFVLVWILCLVISLFVEKEFMNSSINEEIYNLANSSWILKFFCELSPVDFIKITVD